ncbi:ABC transporter ATP-binding protein [Streptosporangium sp. NBC_01469]|uniref:ABC transporter ATP-binding protein n=1 Tax=Streptosporangium sp. NBC_01469 TaxID=2903898 RepID=UPI002E29FC6F|nr:ABC transporter ATP-binding protein [Streptosporangium sp. NBC_01469]
MTWTGRVGAAGTGEPRLPAPREPVAEGVGVARPRGENPHGPGPAGRGLRVAGLSVSYRTARGETPAVTDVSFDVAPGETYGIVGESGCGKTTLSRALGRHLPPGASITGGGVTVDGVEVLDLSPADLRRWRTTSLAVVHQEAGSSLDPTMRIGAQLAGVLRLQGRGRAEARREAVSLLAGVRLPDPAAIARRYPHQLSGGQQQRVVIAAALATRPRLLVLDEPTTGLDATVQHEILDLVWALRAETDAAVVLISHDLALVGRLCERVGVLYAGRMVEEGPAAEVMASARHPYTSALLASVPRLGVSRHARELAAIPGRPPVPGEEVRGCAFAPRCALADDLCRERTPVLEAAPGGRRARCHHTGALLAAAPGATGAVTGPAGGTGAPRGVPLLEVRGLTRKYGRTTVVDGVDLTIGRAEVLGLVGESGSGKTTVARAVAGLGPRGTGTIALHGRELAATVGRRDARDRRRVQMVFQNPETSLNPSHTIRAILTRAVRGLGGSRTVAELSARANLDDHLLDARPDRLSGGQKQRAAIARAFAGDPELVVCDEPVSALDVSVQAGVLRLLSEQQRLTGTSYLFISHDLAVVGYLADRIAVMYRGRIVEEGPAGRVLSGPHHPYTASLVAASRARLDGPESARPAGTARADGTGRVDGAGQTGEAERTDESRRIEQTREAERTDRTGQVNGTGQTGESRRLGETARTAEAGRVGKTARAGRTGRAGATGCGFAARCPLRIEGLCDTVDPPVRDTGDGHAVRCHLDAGDLPRAAVPVAAPTAREAQETRETQDGRESRKARDAREKED